MVQFLTVRVLDGRPHTQVLWPRVGGGGRPGARASRAGVPLSSIVVEEDDDAWLASEGMPGTSEDFLLRVARGSDEPAAREEPEDFAWAAPRFEILRHLGTGGFGAVYEVFDRKRGARVALKRSLRLDRGTDERRRFTREFRSLADLDHPNLVRLYELHGEEAAWFFTMELVRGQDARSYVRGEPGQDRGGVPGAGGEARVRAVFRQIAEGLCFLHRAGRVHRDVKPGNVMVSSDGRVVILDFGLAVDLVDDATRLGVAGTPGYMAPEQGLPGPISAAADWYALGMMLHEALVGRLPFRGSASEVMNQKRLIDPPGPMDVAPWAGVPDDLHRLCVDLSRRAPEQRPSGEEVLARLSTRRGPPRPRSERQEPDFVGRCGELQRLREGLDAVRAGTGGEAVVALVHAASGMGKTALVGRFLDELRATEPRAVVLRGRCFEQESIPNKTLEGVVDSLARHVSRMPATEIAAIAPDDVTALARVFPALDQVPGWRASAEPEAADKLGVRRRAIAALRQLLARLAQRALLVVFIDDLQWGDAEGGALLAAVLRPPGAPSMLVLGCYRTEEAERSECLRVLLPALRRASAPAIECREIELGALSEGEAHALVRSALGEGASPAEASRWSRAASEAGGSPFFLVELCRFSADEARRGAPIDDALSLSAMLRARLAELPVDARRALDVLAVAGQPTDRGVLAKASELTDNEPSSVALLRARSFLRSGGTDDADASSWCETYHDRVRAAVLSELAPDAKRRHHGALARALLAHFAQGSKPDLELLATHFEGAGETATASRTWADAADSAMESLAHERAIRLYRQALSGLAGERDAARRRALHEKLGGALALAGHARSAAVAYVAAAEGAPTEAKIAMHLLAAEHYLRSGHLDEGLAMLRGVLDATGVSLPATAVGALGRAIVLMGLLGVRGVGLRPSGISRGGHGARTARPRAPAPDDLARIDAWSAASRGLLYADPARAFYCHMRCVWLALEAGDDERLLRALVLHHGFRASLRGEAPSPASESSLEGRIAELLESLRGSGPRFHAAAGLVESGRGMAKVLGARYLDARKHLERGEAELSSCPIRVGNDLTLARVWLITALYGLGQWRELARRHPIFLAEARECGDRFAEVTLSPFGVLLELMADRPEGAREAIDRMDRWRSSARAAQRSVGFSPVVTTLLYRDEGRGDAARLATPRLWRHPGLLLGVRTSKTVGVYLTYYCAAVDLASAATSEGARRGRRLRAVERSAGALARLDTPFSRASASAVRAAAAACRGERDAARVLVAEAEARFAALDMKHYVAAARRRRGELLGEERGRALIVSADMEMRAEGVVNPARMAAALLPGRW